MSCISNSPFSPVCCMNCNIQLTTRVFCSFQKTPSDPLYPCHSSLIPASTGSRLSSAAAARPNSAIESPAEILRPSSSHHELQHATPDSYHKSGLESPQRFGCIGCWPIIIYRGLVVGMGRTLNSGGRVGLCLTAETKLSSNAP